MKSKLRKILFAGIFVLPMDRVSWDKTNFPFKFAPKFVFTNDSIAVTSKDDLGGYAYQLPQGITVGPKSEIRVSWEIKKFPQVSPEPPFSKKEDDYPLRLGLIFSGGPKAKIPSSVVNKIKLGTEISSILYYGPTKAKISPPIKCGESPHNNYAIYCAVASEQGQNRFNDKPYLRLKEVKAVSYEAKLVGVWLFTDTDDSESKSSAILKSVSIEGLKN